MTIYKQSSISTKVSKKDQYRPLFCRSEFYQEHQRHFNLIDSHASHLDLKTKALIWIITLSCLRRTEDWFGGFTPTEKPTISAEHHLEFSLNNLFKLLEIQWPIKINPDISFIEFCQTVKIKPLPQAAHSAIFHILLDYYPIEILCYEPEPLELLNIQISGKRILTFDTDYQTWADKLYGSRDPLSFWIHDLIHAEHFFKHDELKLGQIGFYKFVKLFLDYPELQNLLKNLDYYGQFSYLISDMNSHPLHLLMTFKAITDIHGGIGIWESLVRRFMVEHPNSIPYHELLIKVDRYAPNIDRDLKLLLDLTNGLNRASS